MQLNIFMIASVFQKVKEGLLLTSKKYLKKMAANDSFSDELQCPVCLLVPREIPIPACPVGHLVCQRCRVNVNICPTCRRPMLKNGTNTLANKMIERIPHPCKYSQCHVKNYLKEIVKHEARCPERTIKCPYLWCNEQVKVAEYHMPLPRRTVIVTLLSFQTLQTIFLKFEAEKPYRIVFPTI